ncbi:2-hydroxyacid dehydrogenase [Pyramidobacter sp.]|uniref:2-hydroxyacid dehydrogenase n=1 Tax=Pyramidobacter sp. TaxID=1943581 RepID=UPI0025D603C9|nr:2-hydroxyacid dehydrogenase [Pyramidobacter sp.]MCI7402686.1 2-hydroxyacid dehydrogenase [Pyramidobacter sp.]MDY3213607.1 2-hydroxyacid dehydrogenase [Pyramidobacter sp.]
MKKILLAGKYPAGTADEFRAQLAGDGAEIVEVTSQDALDASTDADAIVLRVLKASKGTLANKGKLKLICRWGVGVDSVDVPYASARGIAVTNTPGANASAVSELAVLLMLAVGRNLMFHNRSIQNGVWSRTMFTDNAVSLNGKKVGIIGGGNIGRQVARRVQAFGAEARYYDVFRLAPETEKQFDLTFVPLDDLLADSDVVTLHVPLLDNNHHMLNAEKIALMKRNAILINTARGGLVDDKALLTAIDEGRLMGAGLDCVEDDPLPAGHPLLNHPNIVITPHIGGNTSDLGTVMVPMISDTLKKFLHGEKLKFVVNEKELSEQ